MQVKNIEEIDSKTVITTETVIKPEKLIKRWFRDPILRKAITQTRQFKAVSCYVADYHTWVELPNNIMVPDLLSFQLDTWKRLGM